MASIKCGKCSGVHAAVADVKACYAGVNVTEAKVAAKVAEGRWNDRQARIVVAAQQEETSAMYATEHGLDPFGEPVVANAATEKQVAFIAKLGVERNVPVNTDGISKGEASKEISRLLSLPKATRAPASAAGDPVDGIYYVENSNEIYKVYKMVHGSGRQGVKRLDIADDKTGSFTYLGLASSKLPKAAALMSLEAAKAFGRIYGFCVRCGATLTDEGSIADGIGPICAGKGW